MIFNTEVVWEGYNINTDSFLNDVDYVHSMHFMNSEWLKQTVNSLYHSAQIIFTLHHESCADFRVQYSDDVAVYKTLFIVTFKEIVCCQAFFLFSHSHRDQCCNWDLWCVATHRLLFLSVSSSTCSVEIFTSSCMFLKTKQIICKWSV